MNQKLELVSSVCGVLILLSTMYFLSDHYKYKNYVVGNCFTNMNNDTYRRIESIKTIQTGTIVEYTSNYLYIDSSGYDELHYFQLLFPVKIDCIQYEIAVINSNIRIIKEKLYDR